MTTFTPGPAAELDLRRALGTFATGVTVVTTMAPHGPCGITANSFSSVSLDPPLVLWSVGRESDRYGLFSSARFTAIHVLAESQYGLARRFARKGSDFDGVDWELGAEQVPLLEGCLSRFECELAADHEGGDHRILISRVHRVTLAPGTPLVFSGGHFGRFATAV
ncbi:MAG: flavin reductase family protein [Rhodobacteraceae bacterium]|nr:flavin reductase family protein [Paracoccaceae bacterium]